MLWNCFHATLIKQSRVMAWPSSCSSFSCFFASWPVQSWTSVTSAIWESPGQLSSDQTHKGSTRDCSAFVSCWPKGNGALPPFWSGWNMKFIEVSLIHPTYSRQLDKSKHMQTARHKLLIWFKQNHYVVVARFLYPHHILDSNQLSSKWLFPNISCHV